MSAKRTRSGLVADAANSAMQWLYGFSPWTRYGTPYVADVVAWGAAIAFAALLRWELNFTLVNWWPLLIEWLIIAVSQLALGLALKLYRGRHPYGSFDEVVTLCATVVPIGLVVGGAVVVYGPEWGQSRSVILLGLPFALLMMAALRYTKRYLVERAQRPTAGDSVPTIIYGAGDLGSAVARMMLRDPQAVYLPLGFVDDNVNKAHARHHGVRVLGTGAELSEILRETGARTLVVAIAHADAALMRAISGAAPVGVNVKVFPSLSSILSDGAPLGALRDLNIADLVGRTPVDLDVASIAEYVAGKRVLVTGAGGSIGSELALQLARFSPQKVYLLDRDETALQAAQIAISGDGLLQSDDTILADIRDAEALQNIFQRIRPQVVFHAAALKHLPALERFPDEAWKTNVLGTHNVLQASRDVGVEVFVNISTDKAANPTSVLGHSKRVGEKLTAGAAAGTGDRYVSVRFGNVLGSRGSLVPTFLALIDAGKPLTVTHRDATRYFMTIPEACQLVVQAGAIGRQGEVLVLDMGEPVRINDIAERMVEMSGKSVPIVYTGLRAGEKLHEELFGLTERDERPFHPLISHTFTGSMTPDQLDRDKWHNRLTSVTNHSGDATTGITAVVTRNGLVGNG